MTYRISMPILPSLDLWIRHPRILHSYTHYNAMDEFGRVASGKIGGRIDSRCFDEVESEGSWSIWPHYPDRQM